MATVYSYIRFSSKKQEQGDSVRRQLRLGEEWMSKHPEHTLDTSLRLHDLGVSAFRGANLNSEIGALGAFIALAKQPSSPIARGSILLIERLDRFSRQQTRKAYRVFTDLVEAGITVQTLDPPQEINESNLDDLHVVLPLILQMTISHEQSKEKSRRVGSAWDAKRRIARNGTPMSRRCPSWLRWDERTSRFAVTPDGQKAITHIFTRTAEGCGQRQLVKELNARFRPIGRSGVWNTSFVQKVLSDRSVLGEFQPHSFSGDGRRVPTGAVITGYYPRVISDDLFHTAAGSKEVRRRAKGPNSKFVNLFVGLLKGHDGHPLHLMTGRTKRPNGELYIQRRLVSYGHLCKTVGACPHSVNYFALEKTVLDVLHEVDEEMLTPQSDPSQDIAMCRAKIEGIDARIGEITRAMADFSDSATPVEQLITVTAKLNEQRAEAVQALSELERTRATQGKKPLPVARNLIQLIAGKSPQEQHTLRMRLRHAIASIVDMIHVRLIRRDGSRRIDAVIRVTLKTGVTRVILGDRLVRLEDPRAPKGVHNVVPFTEMTPLEVGLYGKSLHPSRRHRDFSVDVDSLGKPRADAQRLPEDTASTGRKTGRKTGRPPGHKKTKR
jgi:DNA invertase Pin-like site-specific DNA recombinase